MAASGGGAEYWIASFNTGHSDNYGRQLDVTSSDEPVFYLGRSSATFGEQGPAWGKLDNTASNLVVKQITSGSGNLYMNYCVDIDSSDNIRVAYRDDAAGTLYTGLATFNSSMSSITTHKEVNTGGGNYLFTVDGSGNFYVAERNDQLAGDDAATLAKYNSSYTKQWGNFSDYTGSIENYYGDVAVNSSGRIYGIGRNSNGNETHINSYTGDNVGFVGITNDTSGTDPLYQSIEIDSNDRVVASMYATNETNYSSPLNKEGIHVTVWNSSHVKQWHKVFLSAGNAPQSFGMTIDSQDNIYVVGSHSGPNRGVVLKLDSSGNYVWGKYFTNSSAVIQTIQDVRVDSNDDLYLYASTSATTKIIYYPGDESVPDGTYGNYTITDIPANSGNTTVAGGSGLTMVTSSLTGGNVSKFRSGGGSSFNNMGSRTLNDETSSVTQSTEII